MHYCHSHTPTWSIFYGGDRRYTEASQIVMIVTRYKMLITFIGKNSLISRHYLRSISVQEDSQSFIEHETKVKENLGICITICFIIFVAIFVTTLKIIFFDQETYPGIFQTSRGLQPSESINVRFSIFFSFSAKLSFFRWQTWQLRSRDNYIS